MLSWDSENISDESNGPREWEQKEKIYKNVRTDRVGLRKSMLTPVPSIGISDHQLLRQGKVLGEGDSTVQGVGHVLRAETIRLQPTE